MALIRAFKPNFIGGEVSPQTYPRIDLPSNVASCRTVKNFNIGELGGIFKRPGSKYIYNFEALRGQVFGIRGYSETEALMMVFHTYGVNDDIGRVLDLEGNTIQALPYTGAPTQFQYNGHEFTDAADFEEIMESVIQNEQIVIANNKTNPFLFRFIGGGDTCQQIYKPDDWAVGITYSIDDVVVDATFIYKSLQDSNTGNTPGPGAVDTAWWEYQGTTLSWFYGFSETDEKNISTIDSRIAIVSNTNNELKVFCTGLEYFGGIRPAKVVATINDDDPFFFELLSNVIGDTKPWSSNLEYLFFGADATEHRLLTGVTPTNIQTNTVSNYGSGGVSGVSQDIVFFLGENRKKLYMLQYVNDGQRYVSQELTTLFSHLFTDEIKQIKTQKSPYQALWIVLKDGSLIVVNFDRTTNQIAATQMDVGGLVDNVSIVRSNAGNDVIGLMVKRGTDYILEIIDYNTETDAGSLIYLDSYVKVDMTAIIDGTVAGLDHLEGEEVYVYADGYVFGLYTVASGEVTILGQNEEPYVPDDTYVYAGLPYDAEVETVTMEIPSQRGVNLNNEKQVAKVTPYLVETAHIKIADQNGVYTE
ncbi:hypothetical protein KAR91_58645, partial [Candidatus Pacearchaeota archaeon]|nr:hypothetical protein [Candidatus Pacearchaeota archaeon]